MVSTGCCSVLDNIVSFLFKKLTKKNKRIQENGHGDGTPLVSILEMRPEILQQVCTVLDIARDATTERVYPVVSLLQMLSTVLNIIMFEDCRNQWSMSRPLLGLILLNEEVSLIPASVSVINSMFINTRHICLVYWVCWMFFTLLS